MASQQVRNLFNTQVDSLISRVKEEVRNEGKRKLTELQKKIPTPEELIKKLQADINEDSCSPKGKEKFEKIYKKLSGKIKKIQNILKSIIEKFDNINAKIDPLFDEEETSGPISKMKEVLAVLDEYILPILKTAILIAPILLAANSGPTSSGQVTDAVSTKRNKAIAKTAEYVALVASVPLMIMFYKKEVEKIYKKLDPIKQKLNTLKEKLDKLMMFLVSLRLQYMEGCNELHNAQNASIGVNGNPIVPDPNGSTPLQKYMDLLKDQYKDVYDKLQEAGDEKALERLYTLKENLEEDFNISFKIININKKSN